MNRIRELRKKSQLTQAALGKALHISQGMVSAYENEETPLTAELISQLAEFFQVSTDYLLGRDTPTPPEPEQPHDPMAEWNVQYPAGVALRRPPMYDPTPSLSEQDVTRIAEKVAQMSRDAKTSPILNQSEQQLVEEYRLLNSAGRIRVQRLIDQLLDNKFSGE